MKFDSKKKSTIFGLLFSPTSACYRKKRWLHCISLTISYRDCDNFTKTWVENLEIILTASFGKCEFIHLLISWLHCVKNT